MKENKILNFMGKEISNLAIGYLAGMSASMLVSQFFVKKKLVNLWGLTAKREAVSGDTYEWLMFFSSYLIGLIVMVLVNYALQKLRKKESSAA